MLKKVLVIRNDKLGDFMLAWPSYALLKKALPGAKVHALVPEYTRELAELCPSIDRVLVDPGRDSGWKGLMKLRDVLREQQYDAAIALYSTNRVGTATVLAGIPYRLAPATRLAQFWFNQRLVQRRSESSKPEWVYNLELIQHCLRAHAVPVPSTPEPPYLEFPPADTEALHRRFCAEHGVADEARLVFIHPGSGGSSKTLNPEQYAQLAGALRVDTPLCFVVTAGPGEQSAAAAVTALLRAGGLAAVAYHSRTGLADFSAHLCLADLFISGSTGPLHIAGALDRPTVGFYPSRRTASQLRWQTLNTPDRRLAFSQPESSSQRYMMATDLDAAAEAIKTHFLRCDSRRRRVL